MTLGPKKPVGQCIVEVEDDGILCSSHIFLVEYNPVNQLSFFAHFLKSIEGKISLLLQEVQVNSTGCSSRDQNVLDAIRVLDQPDAINYSTK